MNGAVTLAFSADTVNVRLARSVAGAMAERADFPLDQLEDVRLAVDEAVSQLILDAAGDTEIVLTFSASGPELDVTVSAVTRGAQVPATDTFSWAVLRALVDDVAASVEDGTVTLRLHITRALTVDG